MPDIYHFRDQRGIKVDVVMESLAGDVTGVEAKARASIAAKDTKGLIRLRGAIGPSFKAGVVIYTGAQTVPLGDRLWAVPVSALWNQNNPQS